MQRDLILAFFAVVLGASGTYLLLPHGHGSRKPRTAHAAGAALAGLALLLFAALWSPPAGLAADLGRFVSGAFFYAFALGAVASAVLTVTSRDPIHSALWFAAVVLATTGLFVQAGASFLAAGTVIVYAGAVIVTFLFVIMLAQMEGRAPYDRAARMPLRSTWTCFLLFFGVVWSILHVTPPQAPADGAGATVVALPRTDAVAAQAAPLAVRPVADVIARAARPTALLSDPQGRPKPHVAGLGETLYTDHLVTVELAGTLLFVALIGALAIAAPKPPVRSGETRGMATVKASTPEPTKANV